MPDSYNVRIISGANIVVEDADIPADELHDAVTRHTEDYLDLDSGYTMEIKANQ